MSESLRRLTSLRRLSLQSNRLASMAGFEHCIHLEELYLSHNGISKLEVRFCWDLLHMTTCTTAAHSFITNRHVGR